MYTPAAQGDQTPEATLDAFDPGEIGGTLTTPHSFDSTDGANPVAGLIQTTDGNFYGTTVFGGANCAPQGCGTVFKITPRGTLTTLHSFDGAADGAFPVAGLIQATDGNFYGTTEQGGEYSLYCRTIGCGTVFEVTPNGTLTTLHEFDGTDGASPQAGLVQATDGNFYGTTYLGGPRGYGTVFKITPAGTLTVLHRFDKADGAEPSAGLIQATDGNFYGTTRGGGANDYGTVFSLSVGLGPFVKTQPSSAVVGSAVIILGNNLTGATSVTFNGKAARFHVVSSSEIATAVPGDVTTDRVEVVKPGGVLASNVMFGVAPSISGFSPTIGTVGTEAVITGEALTGATRVTFGGVEARSFTMDSYTKITATIPW